MQWRAYQLLAGPRGDAHEVVDQFWLSSHVCQRVSCTGYETHHGQVRSLLTILDVSSVDQAARSKRKGRPKQPSPTFHLPYDLWDHDTLPVLRAKDASGLPISGAAGIVLFRFHVEEAVQSEHPEWAQGLYDNPPLPEEDALLPSLPALMNSQAYQHLKPMTKAGLESAVARPLSLDEIEQISSRPRGPHNERKHDDGVQTPQATSTLNEADLMSRSLESFAALTSNNATLPISTNDPFILDPNSLANLPSTETTAGPSLGSSVRARKQSKKSASELPGGAAMPVPTRWSVKKEHVVLDGDEGVEVDVDLRGDGAFLDSL